MKGGAGIVADSLQKHVNMLFIMQNITVLVF